MVAADLGSSLGVYRAVLPLNHAVVPYTHKKNRPEHYTLREFLDATSSLITRDVVVFGTKETLCVSMSNVRISSSL